MLQSASIHLALCRMFAQAEKEMRKPCIAFTHPSLTPLSAFKTFCSRGEDDLRRTVQHVSCYYLSPGPSDIHLLAVWQDLDLSIVIFCAVCADQTKASIFL